MLSTLDLDEAAQNAAGNWQQFDSFVWWRKSKLTDPNQWGIFYTSHRDSGLLDQSNSAVISKALEPFTEGDDPEVVMESHSHWAVGFINGFSVRVFDVNGDITEAFRKYHELTQAMDDYPVLDESDYSDREYEATLENITDAAWRLKNQFDLPDGWESEVYSWLSENDPCEIENVDDQGGYPSESALKEAFAALGFNPAE